MTLKLFKLTAIIFLFFTSCKSYQDIQCTGISGVKLNNLNTDGIDADVMVKVKNPNSTSFSIYKSEFEVLFGGIKLGTAKLSQAVKIKGNAEEAYAFKLKGSFKGVSLENVMALLEGFTRKGNFEVKGDLNVGKMMVKKKVPISLKNELRAD